MSDGTRTFGTMRLIDAGANWEIAKLEPHVAIRFKQIFPRVPKNSAGPFKLPRDIMHAADLTWFTSRYPLAIRDDEAHALAHEKGLFDIQQAELERILAPDYKAPSSIGLREDQSLRRYQTQAIEVLRRRRSLLLGDEGGLGKTYVAAAFMASEPGALPAAVVCDPHMQKQWRDKTTAFTHLRVHVIKKGSPYNLPVADVYVFRVSQIKGWIDFFATGFFKAAIFDEPQSLRTGTSTAKGAAAKVLAQQALWRLGLTATPIYNYGVEIWNVMQFIDDLALGSYHDFLREWGDDDGRVKDPKALGAYLREQHVFLRRLKSDVGLQLPKVSRIVEYVEHDEKAVQSVEDLARKLAIRATTGSFVERGQAARELDMMVRQATGISKARSVAQFVRLLVDAGEPVLLLGWHREVYDIWLRDLADLNPAMYTGSESTAKKDAELQRFLDKQTNVLIMSLRSGAGLDGLQHRCSICVFGELDWSPGIHQQIIWRLDRDGQPLPVTAFFLVSGDGSDPPIMDVLGIKASEAHQIVDPHMGMQSNVADTSNLKKLVERYLEKMRTRPAGAPIHDAPEQQPRDEQADLFATEPS